MLRSYSISARNVPVKCMSRVSQHEREARLLALRSRTETGLPWSTFALMRRRPAKTTAGPVRKTAPAKLSTTEEMHGFNFRNDAAWNMCDTGMLSVSTSCSKGRDPLSPPDTILQHNLPFGFGRPALSKLLDASCSNLICEVTYSCM